MKAFTLIELVVVIAILAIMAAVAIPRFVNLQCKANVNTEKAIIGALNSSIQLRHAENYLECLDSAKAWPGTTDYPFSPSPFELLQNPPKYDLVNTWPGAPPADGQTWRIWDVPAPGGGNPLWRIFCPHYDGRGASQKGYYWDYHYGPNDVDKGKIIPHLGTNSHGCD